MYIISALLAQSPLSLQKKKSINVKKLDLECIDSNKASLEALVKCIQLLPRLTELELSFTILYTLSKFDPKN